MITMKDRVVCIYYYKYSHWIYSKSNKTRKINHLNHSMIDLQIYPKLVLGSLVFMTLSYFQHSFVKQKEMFEMVHWAQGFEEKIEYFNTNNNIPNIRVL